MGDPTQRQVYSQRLRRSLNFYGTLVEYTTRTHSTQYVDYKRSTPLAPSRTSIARYPGTHASEITPGETPLTTRAVSLKIPTVPETRLLPNRANTASAHLIITPAFHNHRASEPEPFPSPPGLRLAHATNSHGFHLGFHVTKRVLHEG